MSMTDSDASAFAAAAGTSRGPAPKFFIYEEPALNHHWLRHCARFKELRLGSRAENTAEYGLHRALHRHPARTRNPSEAQLFYLPVFEYTSKFIGAACNRSAASSDVGAMNISEAFNPPAGLSDHPSRMAAARDALLRAAPFRARGGRDHVWATTAFSAHGYSLTGRMSPLSALLTCSSVGRYKSGPFSRTSAGGACVVEVPYQASLHVMRAARDASVAGMRAHGAAEATRRHTLLFFAGSLDVCCTGRQGMCISTHLPTSPHISSHIPTYPHISPHLTTSHHISVLTTTHHLPPHLPTSAHISPHLTTSHHISPHLTTTHHIHDLLSHLPCAVCYSAIKCAARSPTYTSLRTACPTSQSDRRALARAHAGHSSALPTSPRLHGLSTRHRPTTAPAGYIAAARRTRQWRAT